jgi:hypothetical protein
MTTDEEIAALSIEASSVHRRLIGRIVSCRGRGIRLKRLRISPTEYGALLWGWTEVSGLMPLGDQHTFCGYPIVVNWERQG